MDVPSTVTTALADQPVSGAVCLEAGAGFGNTTAGLIEAGASRVYAVTNDCDHARSVRQRVGTGDDDRTAVLLADLQDIPVASNSVELITAHGLFNLLPPASLGAVATELTRVATPGCHLVIDDYDLLPEDAAVRELFALENAATRMAEGQPALTFYPTAVLRRLFAGYGWEPGRERTLLDPVPWTESHLSAHADVVRSAASRLSPDLEAELTATADRLVTEIGQESVGRMYSVTLRLPAPTAT